MKKLSDYKGDEAIELWADLIEPLTEILTDPKIKEVISSGKPKATIAKELITLHKTEVTDILLRIDDSPIDGLSVILRLISLLTELGENPVIKSFFGFAAQAKTENESSGSVMENTEESEN